MEGAGTAQQEKDTSDFDHEPSRGRGTGPAARSANTDPGCQSSPGAALLGRRVRVHGLAGKVELNEQIGLVKSFDEAKQRYRVQLDTPPTGSSRVLAFKQDNLKVIDS